MRYEIRVHLLSIIFKIQNNTADDARSSSVHSIHLNILKIVFVYLIRHNIEYKFNILIITYYILTRLLYVQVCSICAIRLYPIRMLGVCVYIYIWLVLKRLNVNYYSNELVESNILSR